MGGHPCPPKQPIGRSGEELNIQDVQDPELQHGVQARRSGIIREGKGHIRTTCYSSRSASHCSLKKRPMVPARPSPTFGSQGSPAVIVDPPSPSSGLQDFCQFTSWDDVALWEKKKK
ncbi:hypothetical protein F2P79_011721 [Pimephales promelas]|nr:hypothetical protein F2P79_011721 [Pimephales promelas]